MLALIILAGSLATSVYGYPNGAPLASCGTFTLGSGIYVANPPPQYASDNYSLHFGTPNSTSPLVIAIPNNPPYLPDGRGYSNVTSESIKILSAGVPATSYVPGSVYNVTVTAIKGFHGFLVGANAVSGASGGDVGIISGYSISGTYFNQTLSQFQILNCPLSNYVTHNGISGQTPKPPYYNMTAGIDINFNSLTPPSSYGFMVTWTAPPAGTGTVWVGATIVYSYNPRLSNMVQAPGAVFLYSVLDEYVAPSTTTTTTTPPDTTTTTTIATTPSTTATTTTASTTTPTTVTSQAMSSTSNSTSTASTATTPSTATTVTTATTTLTTLPTTSLQTTVTAAASSTPSIDAASTTSIVTQSSTTATTSSTAAITARPTITTSSSATPSTTVERVTATPSTAQTVVTSTSSTSGSTTTATTGPTSITGTIATTNTLVTTPTTTTTTTSRTEGTSSACVNTGPAANQNGVAASPSSASSSINMMTPVQLFLAFLGTFVAGILATITTIAVVNRIKASNAARLAEARV